MSKAKKQTKANGKSRSKKSEAVAAELVQRAEREHAEAKSAAPRDPRLPGAGTILAKQRGKETHEVTVLADGFEYKGEKYRSLSKIARLITGVSWNGFAFFGLTTREQTKTA